MENPITLYVWRDSLFENHPYIPGESCLSHVGSVASRCASQQVGPVAGLNPSPPQNTAFSLAFPFYELSLYMHKYRGFPSTENLKTMILLE